MSNKPMKISPSQIATKRDCLRKWLFENFLRIPSVKKAYFAFGSILHAVLERWLLADDNGRDRQGRAVNLYPDGWETFTERDGTETTISEEEQDLIKDLVQQAIEQGLVERTPGRLIEEYYAREVVDGVFIHGFMDMQLLEQLRVDDHKTTKSKRYIMSQNKLHGDIKMRCYAIEMAMRWFDLYNQQPDGILMRLNYFVKDPLKPTVKKVQANIATEELEGEWERICEDAEEMKLWGEKYKKFLDFDKVPNYTSLDHEEIPGPESTDVCNKYGGCPYQNICTGRETVQQYFRRVDKILHPKVIKEKKTMGSIFASRLKEIKAAKGTAVAEKEEPQPEAHPAAPEEDSQVVAQPPPWANEKCTKCGGSGLDEHGSACAICFKLAKQAGLPLPADCRFDDATGQWIIYQETKDDEAIHVMGADGKLKEAAAPPAEEPAAEEPAKDKLTPKGKGSNALSAAKKLKQAQRKLEKEAEASEPEPEKPKATKAKATKAKDKEPANKNLGRPPMGFTLCIGVAPMRTGTREVLYAEQLLDKAKEMIVAELKQQYEEQDPFKRRDMAVLAVRSMTEGMGSAIIVAPNLNYATQDLRAVVEELKVHAQTVYASIGY